MRKVFVVKFGVAAIFAAIIFGVSTLSATTYVRLVVNGDTSATTMVQGDMMSWSADCGVGDTLFFEDYLDLNSNHIIDAGDKLVLAWHMVDGDTSSYNGPTDSNPIPDGVILFAGMPIGFQAGNYCIRATDKDMSSASDYIAVTALPSPPATVSGKVSIEGVTAPNALLQYIMVAAEGQYGMWAGLTDAYGDYTINLGASGNVWYIHTMMGKEGYERDDTTLLVTGNVTGINFFYKLGVEEASKINSKIASIEVKSPLVFNNVDIRYILTKEAKVSAGLYNSTGMLVKKLVNDSRKAGSYNINLNTGELSAGVYFLKLQANQYKEMKKLILIK